MQHMPQTLSLTLSNKHCCIFWRKEIPLLWRGILWDSGFQFKSVITHPHPKCFRTLRDVFKFCDIFYVPSQIGNNWACGSWGIGGGLPSSWPEKETHWLVSRPGSVLAFLCGCLPFKFPVDGDGCFVPWRGCQKLFWWVSIMCNWTQPPLLCCICLFACVN